jgi:tyrosine-protein kinase Etk/Wzc
MLCTLIGISVGVAMAYVLKPKGRLYQGEGVVLVEPTTWEKEIFKGTTQTSLIKATPQRFIQRTNMQSLAEEVVRDLVRRDVAAGSAWGNIAEEDEYAQKARELLSVNRLQIKSAKEPFITVSAQGNSQEEIAPIVDTATRVFIEGNRQVLLQEEEQTHQFIVDQLADLRERLDRAESDEWEARREMGFRTHDQVLAEMDRMRVELNSAVTTKAELEGKQTEIETALFDKEEQLPAALEQLNEGVVQELLAELNVLRSEEVSMRVVYQDIHKPLQLLRLDIEDKKDAVLEAVRELDSGLDSGSTVWKGRQNLREQYVKLQLDLTGLEIRTSTIEKLLTKKLTELPELASKDLAYRKLERNTEQLREQFNKMLDLEFDTLTALRRGTGQLKRHTSVTIRPVGGAADRIRSWSLLPLGAALGFAFGVAIALFIEMNDTSIRNIEDVGEYLDMEVIGTIPKMRFEKWGARKRGNVVVMEGNEEIDACMVTHHDPKSPISEAYRTFRTNFQLSTMQERPKSVMITSAVPGEGKTTTAVNFAVTLADSGVNVLLIDTDLRRPHVHHVLKMDRGPGLADVLREGLDYHSVVRPTRVENLSIISSGRVPPNPSELIGSERMQSLMRDLGQEFDLIVCDAPSILVVTDPILLSTYIDTSVLVVAANNARRETIIRAKRLLESAKANVSGALLNGLEANRRHYYYYYYYYDSGSSRRQGRWTHT